MAVRPVIGFVNFQQAAASHGGFGAGGLAFQLECDEDDDIDGDNSVDHDLISVSHEPSVRRYASQACTTH